MKPSSPSLWPTEQDAEAEAMSCLSTTQLWRTATPIGWTAVDEDRDRRGSPGGEKKKRQIHFYMYVKFYET